VDARDAKRASKVAAPLIINNYQFVDLQSASLHVSEWSRRPADVRGKKVPRE